MLCSFSYAQPPPALLPRCPRPLFSRPCFCSATIPQPTPVGHIAGRVEWRRALRKSPLPHDAASCASNRTVRPGSEFYPATRARVWPGGCSQRAVSNRWHEDIWPDALLSWLDGGRSSPVGNPPPASSAGRLGDRSDRSEERRV